MFDCLESLKDWFSYNLVHLSFEPPRGKTNKVVSEQVQHKQVCAVTETGLKLEFSDLRRRVSVLSV